jgi:hypothetical protein
MLQRLTRVAARLWHKAFGEKRHPRNGELPVEYFRFPPF